MGSSCGRCLRWAAAQLELRGAAGAALRGCGERPGAALALPLAPPPAPPLAPRKQPQGAGPPARACTGPAPASGFGFLPAPHRPHGGATCSSAGPGRGSRFGLAPGVGSWPVTGQCPDFWKVPPWQSRLDRGDTGAGHQFPQRPQTHGRAQRRPFLPPLLPCVLMTRKGSPPPRDTLRGPSVGETLEGGSLPSFPTAPPRCGCEEQKVPTPGRVGSHLSHPGGEKGSPLGELGSGPPCHCQCLSPAILSLVLSSLKIGGGESQRPGRCGSSEGEVGVSGIPTLCLPSWGCEEAWRAGGSHTERSHWFSWLVTSIGPRRSPSGVCRLLRHRSAGERAWICKRYPVLPGRKAAALGPDPSWGDPWEDQGGSKASEGIRSSI